MWLVRMIMVYTWVCVKEQNGCCNANARVTVVWLISPGQWNYGNSGGLLELIGPFHSAATAFNVYRGVGYSRGAKITDKGLACDKL